MKRIQIDDFGEESGKSENLQPSLLLSPLSGLQRSDSSGWAFASLLSPQLLDEFRGFKVDDDEVFLLDDSAGKKSLTAADDQMDDLVEEEAMMLEQSAVEAESSPPRFALDNDLALETSNPYLTIVQQPPREARTRKKKEKRPFTVKVEVKQLPASSSSRKTTVSCRLVFADDFSPVSDETDCSQTVEVKQAGTCVAFEGLGIVNPCLKWKDREYALEIEVDGIPESRIHTRKVYSYSNLGVLQRRRQVQVAGLSARVGSVNGGMRMHLVGKPFFRSERLKVCFRIWCKRTMRWVTLEATNLEFYSESVLFFDTPRIPLSLVTSFPGGEIKAFIQVTNDGTNFSNGMEFVFRAVSAFQSKRLRNDEELHQARL